MPGPLPSESKYVYIANSVVTEGGLGATILDSTYEKVTVQITGLTRGKDVVIGYYANKDGSGVRPTFISPKNVTYIGGTSAISSTEEAISGMCIYTPTNTYVFTGIDECTSETSYWIMAYQA